MGEGDPAETLTEATTGPTEARPTADSAIEPIEALEPGAAVRIEPMPDADMDGLEPADVADDTEPAAEAVPRLARRRTARPSRRAPLTTPRRPRPTTRPAATPRRWPSASRPTDEPDHRGAGSCVEPLRSSRQLRSRRLSSSG